MDDKKQERDKTTEKEPALEIARMPVKTRYSKDEELDYTGLRVTYGGADVTDACAIAPEAGCMWKRDWAKLPVKVTYEAGGEIFAAEFELKRKRRALLIVLAVLAALVAAFLALSMCNGVNPRDMAIIMADSVGITNNNSDVRANIEGTTSFQSPLASDTHWKAGTTSQHFVMANPSGNTVALAPHIYVDFDADGNFAEDECVFNRFSYDASGNVTSYGEFIDVGRQLSDIEIDRKIDAGQYRAKVAYTAVDKETRTLCNGNDFVFDLTVE